VFNNSLYPDPGEKKEERENLKNVVSGVLVIDKPIGLTSHDVVQIGGIGHFDWSGSAIE
jgi:hypothetical protein